MAEPGSNSPSQRPFLYRLRHPIVAAWGIFAALLLVGVWWLAGSGAWSPETVRVQSAAAVAAADSVSGMAVPSSAAPLQTSTRREILPDAVALGLATFRGAAPDGRLHVNGANQLIIDRQLRYWLDSWLSVQGELSLEQVLELITERMNQLPDPGRTEALALLDAYLGYRNQLASYDDRTGRSLTSGDLEALQQRLDWTERLRLQWFTAAVSQAFFAQDDILDQRFLAQQALRQAANANANAHTNTEDDSNSTMVLEQQLQALEQQLAPELQQARSQSRRLITLQQGEQQLARQGADSDTLQQWRGDQFGEQAAQRLAVLDQQRQLWQQRLQDYATLSGKLSGQLSGQQGEQALARYRTEHFTTTEQKRLKAALQLLP